MSLLRRLRNLNLVGGGIKIQSFLQSHKDLHVTLKFYLGQYWELYHKVREIFPKSLQKAYLPEFGSFTHNNRALNDLRVSDCSNRLCG